MPQKRPTKKKKNDEQVFLYAAIIGSFVMAAAFCLLLVALNRQEKAPAAESLQTLENPPSLLIPPDHPRQLVDFTLTNPAANVVTRSDLAGKVLVVDFLFTSCSLTCPAVNTGMSLIQQLTTNDPQVKLVSITVDPDDDTPAVLEKYGERFGADTNRWLFLTGQRFQLYHLIGTSFLAPDTDDAFNYMPGNFAHTERVAVVDTHGLLRGYFDGLNQNTPAAVVAEINQIEKQSL
ncbi:MAG: SCO family protein [Limisphaerales bacterium]